MSWHTLKQATWLEQLVLLKDSLDIKWKACIHVIEMRLEELLDLCITAEKYPTPAIMPYFRGSIDPVKNGLLLYQPMCFSNNPPAVHPR